MVDAAPVDALSDLLARVDVEGIMTGGFAVRGTWTSQAHLTQPFKLIALVAGTAWVSTDGPGGPDGPMEIGPGDVVLLNHRTWLDIRGAGTSDEPQALVPEESFDATTLATANLETDDVLVGGSIRVSPVGSELLRNALPAVVHIAAGSPSSSRSAALVQRLFDEASGARLGSAFAIRQNAQLLLLEVLRAYVGQGQPKVGWLRLLADERMAPAMRSLHAEPGHDWGLAELASAAGMSRTVFAERFRALAGEPPLTYLANWRMTLAQEALRDPDTRVGQLAAQLGYGSESAFSNAFKRIVGEAPLRYRQRAGAARATAGRPPPNLAHRIPTSSAQTGTGVQGSAGRSQAGALGD
ncbi:AraC family transcriptional regulator [Cellulomonas sp. ICMP 17802]|uniref:AraC family transcriptional regulator n=1 Tax=Cellulomonas sp. ICMP 17802 TaxID=3239199 RepID=UPI00351AC4AE